LSIERLEFYLLLFGLVLAMSNDKSLLKVAKGGAIQVLGQLISAGLGFVITMVVARALLRADFGLVSFGYTLANVGVIIALLGLRSGLPRYIAASKDTQAVSLHLFVLQLLPVNLFMALLLALMLFSPQSGLNFGSINRALHQFCR
jgi:O-antigen/teichoic acid export membrane protein